MSNEHCGSHGRTEQDINVEPFGAIKNVSMAATGWMLIDFANPSIQVVIGEGRYEEICPSPLLSTSEIRAKDAVVASVNKFEDRVTMQIMDEFICDGRTMVLVMHGVQETVDVDSLAKTLCQAMLKFVI